MKKTQFIALYFIFAIEIQGFCSVALLLSHSAPTKRLRRTNHSSIKDTFFLKKRIHVMMNEHESSKVVDSNEQSLEDIYNQLKIDEKWIPTVSTSTFLLTLGVGLPFWISILLPMTMVYQLGKAILVAKTTDDASAADSVEIDYRFDFSSDIIPMKDRKYDIVLFGATGFTGKLAALYLCREYGARGAVKWAIAGRSKEKLETIKSEIAQELRNSDMMAVDTIVADTDNRETLHNLVKDSRALASTVGPFALYGSNVVEFCAKYGTHYVDITGEKEWSMQMIAKWDTEAQRTGAKIISFCGHDSVPWDLTQFKLAEVLEKEKDEIVKVECFDEMRSAGVSGGTLATMLNGIDGYKAPKYLSDPWMKKCDGSTSVFKTKVESPLFPERVASTGKGSCSQKWVAPFIMTIINGEVVKRSIALKSTGNSTVTYKEGLLFEDFKTAFVNTFGLYIGLTAILNPVFGLFLRTFIIPKPGQGPSKEAMEKGYLCVHGIGTGSKGTIVESAMYFPHDAGYQETARILVESGLCLALDNAKLPFQVGGFFTPSTGIGNVLLYRLCKTGTMFRCRVMSDTTQSKI